jgi:ACS family hexuronate transporter-like MFS transporter
MASTEVRTSAAGSYRWSICGLLFFATTVNYVDRQILGVLAGTLQREVGWTESEYGFIITAFQASYAIGLLGFGRILDRIGTRAGYIFSVAIWSAAAAAHAAAGSALGFGVARAFLGFGEAGNFPAAVKTVAQWFEKKERALAIGVFNSGSNAGAILTPLLVPWLTLRYGWRLAFAITGAAGALWIAAWLAVYKPRSAPVDDSEPVGPPIPWRSLLSLRETWVFLIARFLTDPVWWFYLYWVPKFLESKHGLTLAQSGAPLIVIYAGAILGSIVGGWISSLLLRRGWSLNAARKTAILVCALLVAPMVFCGEVRHLWTAVLILSLATAGHQGWAANMFACLSDLFPGRAVSSVVGITGFGGSVGGMLAATAVGFLLQATGSYTPAFVWAGLSYLFVLGMIHCAIPRLAPVTIDRPTPRMDAQTMA